MREKYSSAIRPNEESDFFVTIDFDGTVTGFDITDAVIKEFARSGWEEAESLWETGIIGSRECLSRQMSLIDTPLEDLLQYARKFSPHESFADFVGFMRQRGIPFAIVSDGFQEIIGEILVHAGIGGIPVYANRLRQADCGLKTFFPYADDECTSGTCKCMIAERLGGTLPVIHVGDGRSDFCLAGKTSYVFSTNRLTEHCREQSIPHTPFTDFTVIEKSLKLLTDRLRRPERAPAYLSENSRLLLEIIEEL